MASSIAISFGATAYGLKRFAHFFSMGYGLAIASMAGAGLLSAKVVPPACPVHIAGTILATSAAQSNVAESDNPNDSSQIALQLSCSLIIASAFCRHARARG